MLNEQQLLAVKKEFLDTLWTAIDPKSKTEYRTVYNNFLKGLALGMSVEFSKLESQLDKHMMSDHFLQQKIEFHSQKEIYQYIKQERKSLRDY